MNRIKELRKEKKITQKTLSEHLGIPYRTLQNWENGTRQIKQDKAEILADFFGVSTAYLLGLSERRLSDEDVKKVQALEKKALTFSHEDFLNEIEFFRDNIVPSAEISNFFNTFSNLTYIVMDRDLLFGLTKAESEAIKSILLSTQQMEKHLNTMNSILNNKINKQK